ncbi:hypothetical protein ABPG72_001666 [Tetrahymena utriculariae]
MQQQSILNNNMHNQLQYNQNLLANRSMKMVQPFAPQYYQVEQQPRISQFQHDMCDIDKKIVKCALKKKRMLHVLLTKIAFLKHEQKIVKEQLDEKIIWIMGTMYCNKQDNKNCNKQDIKNCDKQDTKDLQIINSNCVQSEEENQVIQNKSAQENKQPSYSNSHVNKNSCKNASQDILVGRSQDFSNKLTDQKTQQLKKEIIESNDTSFEETPKFNQKKVQQSPQDIQNITQVEKRDLQKSADTNRKQSNTLNDSLVFNKKRSSQKVSEFDCNENQVNREKIRDPQKKVKKSEKYQQKLMQKQKQKPYQLTENNSQKTAQKTQKEKNKADKYHLFEQQHNLYKPQSQKQVKVEETNFDDDFEQNSDFEFEENTKDFNKKQYNVDKNLNQIEDTKNLQKKSLDEAHVEENQRVNNSELQKQENDEFGRDQNFQTPVKSVSENLSSRESLLNKEQSRDKQSPFSTEIKVQSQNCHLLNSPNESAIESTQPSQNEQFQSSLMSQSNDQTQLIFHSSNTKVEQLEEQLIQFISEGQRDLDSVLEKAFHLRDLLGLTKKDLTLSEKWYKQFLQKYQIEFEE